MSDGQPQPSDRARKIETGLGMFGCALLLAVAAVFLWRGIALPPGPPELSLEVATVTESEAAYHRAEVVLRNTGAAAAKVTVQGQLLDEQGTVLETSTATVDYVPRRSSAQATLLFSRDPQDFSLQVRPMSYEEP